MRFSSPPVDSIHNVNGGSSASGVNPYAAPAVHNRQGYVHSPNPNAVPSVQGYNTNQAAPYQAAWPGMNDATAQMGVQFGKSAVAAGQDYVEKNVSRCLWTVG